jgi:hypothetical protein
MATPNLGIEEVSASQSQKEVTINNALIDLDNATQDLISIAISGNTSVTADQYTENFVLRLTGSPGAGFDLDIPATNRFFFVDNNTSQTATVQVTGGGGVSVDIVTLESRLLYCDGTDVVEAGGGGGGGGSGSVDVTIRTETASHVLELVDSNSLIRMNVGAANTVTVPLNASVAFPIGTQVHVTQTGAGTTSFLAAGGVTLDTPETLNLRKQDSTASIVKVATDQWLVLGDLELSP